MASRAQPRQRLPRAAESASGRYADLPDVRFHALRHTAATLMLEANVNPRVVQEILGHANIRQTMDTYSHVLPNMQQQAAERMDEMLG